MSYKIEITPSFQKECKKSGLFNKSSGFHNRIKNAISCWSSGSPLPSGYSDHSLNKDKYNAVEYNKSISGVRGDLREFHVNGNYVVIYKKYDDGVNMIELLHGGKHMDLVHSSEDL